MILRHPSSGAFVSHCGWSSFNESIKFGVPIIGVPMQTDGPVANLVVEIRVGVQVRRDSEGKFKREEIGDAIINEGKDSEEAMRRKAKELSMRMKEKGEEDIDNAVEKLMHICRKKREIYQ
ncbi:Crocetin glucoside glucosyltransferase-like [Heracleum sosnowskyi]|uniref:Crocetin glucoside glucosyltransferase-like n=1 Tax=Heracleum sosnowskyi TaxID=360622 RepID=A0AAD8J2P8_9APIA|nr:Crocetin glucoside glucosyltransferase-like [Heracleum sosnowskyi]